MFTDQNSRQIETEDKINMILNNWVDAIKIKYSTEIKYKTYVE